MCSNLDSNLVVDFMCFDIFPLFFSLSLIYFLLLLAGSIKRQKNEFVLIYWVSEYI